MQQDAGSVQVRPNADGSRTVIVKDASGKETRIEVSRGGRVQGDVGGLSELARLRELAGTPAFAPAPRRRQIPEGLTDLLTIIFTFVAIVSIGTPFAKAIAKRIERQGDAPRVPNDVAQRLQAIEQAVDSVAIEVERISEGQRFTSKLLADRARVEVER